MGMHCHRSMRAVPAKGKFVQTCAGQHSGKKRVAGGWNTGGPGQGEGWYRQVALTPNCAQASSSPLQDTAQACSSTG